MLSMGRDALEMGWRRTVWCETGALEGAGEKERAVLGCATRSDE